MCPFLLRAALIVIVPHAADGSGRELANPGSRLANAWRSSETASFRSWERCA